MRAMLLGPRVYSTGPGVFGDYVEDPIRDLDHARDVLETLQRVLRHEDDQDVHGWEPSAASVGDHGREGAGPDADDGGWASASCTSCR